MFDVTSFRPAEFGFDLNNREIVALAYTTAFFLWASIAVRSAAWGVIRAFCQPKVLAVFIAMTAYVILCVAVLAQLHFWEWTNLKTTLVWWAAFAVTSMFQVNKITEERGAFGKLVREAINWTAVVIFIAELESFPIWVEALLLPLLTVIGMMLVLAPHQPRGTILVKPLSFLQSIAGLAILGYSVWQILADLSGFATLNTLREFGVPILLTLLFLPFLYGLAVIMTHESTFTSLRIWMNNDGLARYAERKAALAFGLDIDASKRLARDIRNNDINDRKGVDAAVRQIRLLKKRERQPPVTSPEQGWSPHEATRFLEAHGVVAGDWHAAFGEWRAEASSVKLGDRPLPDRVSYYLSGTEFAVTRIKLTLNADHLNDNAPSDEAFFAMIRTLLGHALPEKRAESALGRLRGKKDLSFGVDGKKFSIGFDAWGIGKRGGYSRDFVMRHEAHVPTEYEPEFYQVAAGEA